ncbi:hypothetical protein [Candidatus Albibeggiatoa sp. nov. BB20]|uniref:hypothetical protein n=1 Tax=Candidatus Albibeggiatoa sp. nov. BB20 TaxID=3162723 RepID=UPI00336556BC
MSKKSNKKKTVNPTQWRWQLDILLLLLTASIVLWTVVKIQLIDMSRVTQAYLPPLEEPQGFAVASRERNWLETEESVMNPLIKKSEQHQAETAKDIAEAQESTIIASATKPKARKKLESWREIAPKKPVQTAAPKRAYVTSSEKINKKAALTPKDELF